MPTRNPTFFPGDREILGHAYATYLQNGMWDALAFPADVYNNGTEDIILSPVRELVWYVVSTGDREMLRLLGRFLLALRSESPVRLAYAVLLSRWQIARYQLFAIRIADPDSDAPAVPRPPFARPRPPTAPLAPPALLTAS